MVEEWNTPPFEATVATITCAVGELPRVGIQVTERALLYCVVLRLGPIGVAAVTRLIRVPTLERETGHSMIKVSSVPSFGGVAIAARRLTIGGGMRTLVTVAVPAGCLESTALAFRLFSHDLPGG